jgi:cytosine/adenosine deaminase-related metal-dependent hydrolase
MSVVSISRLLLVTGEAKSRFELDDLTERGRALIEESISFGVTHMRAFVEVDQGVGLKCLEAGLLLRDEFMDRCYISICVFAQDPIFSYEDGGEAMIRLLKEAVGKPGVEALGSTPYVEKGDIQMQIKNMEFAIRTAKEYKLHLDFHIDYNLDPSKESSILHAIGLLHSIGWPSDPASPDFRTIVFGHCTRLTLFEEEEWLELRRKIQNLPVSFVGLPTSDMFMMGRPAASSGGGQRPRGTLQVPQMIQKYGLNAALGINNVGNAFTPHGSCDPLSLASFGVGVYQAGTKVDAEILLVRPRR